MITIEFIRLIHKQKRRQKIRINEKKSREILVSVCIISQKWHRKSRKKKKAGVGKGTICMKCRNSLIYLMTHSLGGRVSASVSVCMSILTDLFIHICNFNTHTHTHTHTHTNTHTYADTHTHTHTHTHTYTHTHRQSLISIRLYQGIFMVVYICVYVCVCAPACACVSDFSIQVCEDVKELAVSEHT